MWNLRSKATKVQYIAILDVGPITTRYSGKDSAFIPELTRECDRHRAHVRPKARF